jgi:hypothetical protein
MRSYNRIGNYARTGINEVDALLIILCYKSFAREKEWIESTGLSLEAFNKAKASLIAFGHLNAAGAVKSDLKTAFWALSHYHSKPQWLKERLGYFSSVEIALN